MGLLQRLGNDIVHPFGLGNAPAPQPVRTPMPMQSRPNIVQTPAPGQLRVAQPQFQAPIHVAPPVMPQPVPQFHIQQPAPVQPLQVQTVPQQNLHVGNKVIQQSPNLRPGIAPQASQPHLNPVFNVLGSASKLINGALINPAIADVGAARAAIGHFTGNQQAAQAGAQQFKTGTQDSVTQFTRPVAEVATTLRDTQDKGQTYHPGSSVEKLLFGDTPIKDVQSKVKDTQAKYGNLAALGEGLFSVANDVPVVGGAVKGAKLGADLAKEAAPKLAVRALAGKDPLKGISTQDVNSLIRVRDAKAGLPNEVQGNDIQTYNKVAKQKGVDPVDLLTQSSGYQARKQMTQYNMGQAKDKLAQFAEAHPVGLSMKPVDDLSTQPIRPAPTEPVPVTQPNPKVVSPATKLTPALPSEAVPTQPSLAKAASGDTSLVKNTLPRSQQTGLALSKPSKMDAKAFAETFGGTESDAKQILAKAKTEAPNVKPIPEIKPKLTAAENTAKNPVKVNLPEIQNGAYEQARINPQLASHPVDFATGEAVKAQKGLGLTTSQFGKMVEGTLPTTSKAQAKAVQAYKGMTNQAHAASQAVGGNTPYVENYFNHKWDLSNPEQAAKFEQLAQKSGQVDPYNFSGINSQARVFKTIAEGEKAGFKLAEQNPTKTIADYGKGSSFSIKQQALRKSVVEADMHNPTKNATLDIGNGESIPVSKEAKRQFEGYAASDATNNKAVKGLRTFNRKAKQTLLSASEFHPINISALKAGPALALRGHPVMAGKGVFNTFAAQVGHKYSDKLQAAAFKDGTIEASARLGTPIKFGSDYSSEGKLNIGKSGVGEKAIFEKAMPAMHIQMVKGALADLQKRGLSLDSKEAHAVGTQVNNIMGFVNTEVRNLDRGTQRRLGDALLAPQFTRAKWSTLKSAVSDTPLNGKGLAGSYARRAVVGNSAAALTTALALGYLAKQKSDNTKDLLLRSIFHPSIPTNLKDAKGNTQELGLPATYSSEALGLAGFTLKRGSDGHLQVNFGASNIPGNVANYGRSRLAIAPGNALKVATNTNYAGKALYDPTAQAGVKAQQAATTLLQGALPIGVQGIVGSNAVKSHLPAGSQAVINANAPGSNPVVKSLASAVGLTPRTDKTVGKGLQTTQYYDALNAAKKGLNANDAAVYNSIHPQTKNPVTGAYQVQPTVFDGAAKATLYEQHPVVLAADIKLNKQLQANGQTIDPFYNLTPAQQQAQLAYQKMPPAGPDRANWQADNKSWATPFQQARSAFYATLPKGDPNKPKSPLAYPTASTDTQGLMNAYDGITDPKQKGAFIGSHPALQAQFDAQAKYNNDLRTAQGYTALKSHPTASPYVTAQLNAKNFKDPQVQTYLNDSAIYNIAKGGAQDQLVGNSPSQSELKGINSIGNYGLVKNPDGTLAIKTDAGNSTAGTTVQNGAIAIGGFSGSGKGGGGRRGGGGGKVKYGSFGRTASMGLKGFSTKGSKTGLSNGSKGVKLVSYGLPKAPRLAGSPSIKRKVLL